MEVHKFNVQIDIWVCDIEDIWGHKKFHKKAVQNTILGYKGFMLHPGVLRDLRIKKGLSLQYVATHAGTTKSQIDKLEKGERRLTVEWLIRIAEALEIDPGDFLSADFSSGRSSRSRAKYKSSHNIASGSHFSHPFLIAGSDDSRYFLPVQGMIDPLNGTLYNFCEISSTIPRPAVLHGVRQAFALYCFDNRMEPRYTLGDILYADPSRPLTSGCYVCIILTDDRVLIAQFLERHEDTIRIRQFNPEKIFSLKANTIKKLARLVGSIETSA